MLDASAKSLKLEFEKEKWKLEAQERLEVIEQYKLLITLLQDMITNTVIISDLSNHKTYFFVFSIQLF